MHSLISQFPNFSQFITAIFISLFQIRITIFLCLISRVSWFVAFGDSVGALTVTYVTEIPQLAVLWDDYTREGLGKTGVGGA